MALVTSCKTGCAPYHVMTTTTGTGCSLFIIDTARENSSTSWGHTTNITTAEAPATIKGMHHTPHPLTAAAYNTHPSTDALGNTRIDTHHSRPAAGLV